jgi:XTP/dITP diphosphohydrolase
MLPLVVASANIDKVHEICDVMRDAWRTPVAMAPVVVEGSACFVLHDPSEAGVSPVLGSAPDVEETGTTLVENARIKAAGWAVTMGRPAVADDTGLFVDALDGAPGVYSARYAGEHATYADNVAKLVDALRGVPRDERSARFMTVALARRPDGSEVHVEGVVDGMILEEPRGAHGFGYDPVFVPVEGDGRTFAEMTAREKHACSHRGRAFRALAARLAEPW